MICKLYLVKANPFIPCNYHIISFSQFPENCVNKERRSLPLQLISSNTLRRCCTSWTFVLGVLSGQSGVVSGERESFDMENVYSKKWNLVRGTSYRQRWKWAAIKGQRGRRCLQSVVGRRSRTAQFCGVAENIVGAHELWMNRRINNVRGHLENKGSRAIGR